MDDSNSELKTQLRDAQSQARAATAAAADAKKGRMTALVWAGLGGALLVAVGGQWFPGYVLDSTAKDDSRAASMAAVSDVMAALCAERFMRPMGLESRMTAMKARTGDWSQADYIREGIWAAAPDGTKADHNTAEKCRVLIVEGATVEAGKNS